MEEINLKDRIPAIAPPNNNVWGINVMRVVQDHGLGQLDNIDEEIAKHRNKIDELLEQRTKIVKLIQVFDPTVE